jgi:hypothetical protein
MSTQMARELSWLPVSSIAEYPEYQKYLRAKYVKAYNFWKAFAEYEAEEGSEEANMYISRAQHYALATMLDLPTLKTYKSSQFHYVTLNFESPFFSSDIKTGRVDIWSSELSGFEKYARRVIENKAQQYYYQNSKNPYLEDLDEDTIKSDMLLGMSFHLGYLLRESLLSPLIEITRRNYERVLRIQFFEEMSSVFLVPGHPLHGTIRIFMKENIEEDEQWQGLLSEIIEEIEKVPLLDWIESQTENIELYCDVLCSNYERENELD